MATKIVSIPILMLMSESSRPPEEIQKASDNVQALGTSEMERLNQFLNDGYEIIDRESHTHTEDGVFQGVRVLILYKPDNKPELVHAFGIENSVQGSQE